MADYSDDNVMFDNDISSISDSSNGHGVLSGMAVSPSSNMVIAVASGNVAINGTKQAYGGGTPTVTNADGSNPRKDIVTINGSGVITITAGTPAVATPSGSTGRDTYSPVPPDIPANEVILAEVWVGTGVSVINAGDIIDLRQSTKIPDGNSIIDSSGEYKQNKIIAPDGDGIKFYASNGSTHIGTLDENGNFMIKGRFLKL